MKRLLSLTLSLMVLLCAGFVLAEAQPTIYSLNADTFTLTQGPVWSYLYYDYILDDMAELAPAPDQGDHWQFPQPELAEKASYALHISDGLVYAMPASLSGEHIDIVVAFTAPRSGNVEIAPTAFEIRDDGKTYDPYFIRIAKSTSDSLYPQLLFPFDEDWAPTPLTIPIIEAAIEKGEKIFFIVRSGAEVGGAVSIQPTVTYLK